MWYREGGEKRNTASRIFRVFGTVTLLRCRRGSSSRRRRLSIPTRLCCFPQASAVLRPLVVSLLLCCSSPLFRSSPLYRSPLHLSTTCVCACACCVHLCTLRYSPLNLPPAITVPWPWLSVLLSSVLPAWSLRLALASPALSIVRVSLSLARGALLDPPRSQHALAALRCSSTHPCSSNRSCTRVLVGETARALSLSLSLSLLVRVSLCPRVLPTQPHPSPNSTGPCLLPLLLLTAQSFLTHTHPSTHGCLALILTLLRFVSFAAACCRRSHVAARARCRCRAGGAAR